MSRSKNASNPVELWYSRCGAATASAIAIRKHWLQDEFDRPGTILHSLRDSDDDEVQNSHYHHKISGFFREGGNIPPIWARSGGRDTVVVGITWLDEYQGILVRKDSGIQTVADLKGKRLGLPLHGNLIDFQRGAAKHGFTTALSLAGFSHDVATYVDLPAPAEARGRFRNDDQTRRERPRFEVEALLAGKVDAIFLRFAHGVRWARDERLRQVININDLSDPLLRVNNGTPRPVTVDREFLQKHPEIVARYLSVLIKTARWAETHPSDLLNLLVSEGGAVNVEEVVASHGADVHRSFYPQLSETYVAGLDAQKNFLRDHGFLQGDFSVPDWIDPKPLQAAQLLVDREPAFAQPHVERRSTQLESSAT